MRIKSTVPKGLKKIANLPFDKALELSAMEIVGLISDNADKGRGYAGAFTPYSSLYKKRRQKEGLSSRVNLQDSGDMMRSILNSKYTAEKTASGYEITIQPPDRKHINSDSTIEDIVEGNQSLRPFFGINNQYEKVANKKAIDFLSKEYAKLQLS